MQCVVSGAVPAFVDLNSKRKKQSCKLNANNYYYFDEKGKPIARSNVRVFLVLLQEHVFAFIYK